MGSNRGCGGSRCPPPYPNNRPQARVPYFGQRRPLSSIPTQLSRVQEIERRERLGDSMFGGPPRDARGHAIRPPTPIRDTSPPSFLYAMTDSPDTDFDDISPNFAELRRRVRSPSPPPPRVPPQRDERGFAIRPANLAETSAPSFYSSDESSVFGQSASPLANVSPPTFYSDTSESPHVHVTKSTTIITTEDEEEDTSIEDSFPKNNVTFAMPPPSRNATFNVPSNATYNVPANATYNVPANATYNVPADATFNVLDGGFNSQQSASFGSSGFSAYEPTPYHPYSTFTIDPHSFQVGDTLPPGAQLPVISPPRHNRTYTKIERSVTETPSNEGNRSLNASNFGRSAPLAQSTPSESARNYSSQVRRHLAELEEAERTQINQDLDQFQRARRRLVEDANTIASNTGNATFTKTQCSP